MSTTDVSARTACPRQPLSPLKPTNSRILCSADGAPHGMAMLPNASLTENDQNHGDLLKNKTTPRKFPEELCIPKIECPDESYFIDDEALTDFGLTEPLIPFTTPYKLKDPVIELERCDKIWETLTLIKSAQGGYDDYTTDDDTEQSGSQEEEGTGVQDPSPINCGLPYVQYEPVLENNNANIKLSVLTTEKLHNCLTCGNFFSKKRDLQAHVYKFHGIAMPTNGFKQNSTKQGEVKIAKVRPTERERSQNSKQNADKIGPAEKLMKTDFLSVQEKVGSEICAPKLENTKDNVQQTSEFPFECLSDQEKLLIRDYVSCSLCYCPIKDVKKHVTNYHKIVCPDTMITQFSKPMTFKMIQSVLNKIKDKRGHVESDTVQAPPTAIIHSSLSSIDDLEGRHVTLKRRRMSEVSHTESKKRHIEIVPGRKQFQRMHICSICSAMFPTRTGVANHSRACKRSETEQLKSVETVVNQVTKGRSRTLRNSTGKCGNGEVHSELINDTEHKLVMDDKLSNGTEEITQNICVCGRSFRTKYTYSTHKVRCATRYNTEDQEVTSNSDRSPPVGLHLTIKKHNNSYEIVGRDNDGNSGFQSTVAAEPETKCEPDVSKIANEEQVVQNEISVDNLAEYSRNHRFVKLEVVDEDIVVDIEDDTVNNFFDDVGNGTEIKTESAPMSDTSGKENLQDENVLRNEIKLSGNRLKYICPCNKGFETEQSLAEHIEIDHALLSRKCAYCQMIFKSRAALNDHICLVIKGEPYVNLYKIPCCYCNKILDGQHIDDHIKKEHLVSSENNFACYECLEGFETSVKRQRHVFSYHRKPSVCHFCSKTTTTRRIPRHLAYHFGLGFPCHICKLAFIQLYHLTEHSQATHSNNRKCF